ncbi:isopenicillin N synthase family oxygenase [Candidatus Nomurabacteria bacterium]|nr:isopenicillin N synthase family oxygenase [Candidatus Nomurabacteria bacterium]
MEKLNISTLDFNHWAKGDHQEKQLFLSYLRRSLQEPGFFFLDNHGMDQKILDVSESKARSFFTQIREEERLGYTYAHLHHQIGYTPSGVEKGEFAKIADTKKFWQTNPNYSIPIVKEIPGFNQLTLQSYYEFEKIYTELMKAVAMTLELPATYFSDHIGNSVMRDIFYPAHQNPVVDDGMVAEGGNALGMCASMHTDINFLTLLEAKEKGLQLWHEGRWMDITITKPGLIIVNCGDMLQHVTAGYYVSGMHRVVCQPNTPRYARPFFGHLKSGTSIVPLSQFRDFDAKRFRFKTTDEYLNFRLNQIGV